ncbi:MAG: sigma 54-dependent Fis family transcriptional regulator [Candidatus Hydrogenedentes bacterium]|nr:sigma 54-dependent Fis family transcriptional regulator [Candidatus Hydrogenedentota bacterium]
MNLFLTVKSGFTPGASWPVADQPLVLGRAEDCDILVEDPTVSRRHCQVSREGTVLRLLDLGSRNPVLVNGAPALDARLRVGDEFALGSVTFLVSAMSFERSTSTSASEQDDTRSIKLSDLHLFDGTEPGAGEMVWPGSLADYVRLFHFSRRLSLASSIDALLEHLRETVHTRCRMQWTGCLIQEDKRWQILGTSEPLPDPLQAETRLFVRALTQRRAMARTLALQGRQFTMLVSPILCYDREIGVLVSYGPEQEKDTSREHLVVFASVAEILGPFLHAALHLRAMAELNRRHVSAHWGDPPILGESTAAIRLRDEILEAGRTPLNVLLVGETGTGKELVARNLHRISERKGNFVALNCAALPDELFESELFGHTVGAFTGADRLRRGLLAAADGGTLFLDEVGDLSPKNQARLLRVLDEGRFRPLGQDEEREVSLHVIAASNTPLPNEDFRRDLFHRLAQTRIEVPPLRARVSDIPVLAQHFADNMALEYPHLLCSISEEAFNWLVKHPWPGNVRELRHMVERAVHRCRGEELRVAHLGAGDAAGAAPASSTLESLEPVERAHIERVLRHCAGNMARAARILRVSRTTLYAKADAYGLRT